MTHLFSIADLVQYLRPFKIATPRIKKVYQFDGSLFSDKSEESTKIHDTINKSPFVIQEIEVSNIVFMPCTGMHIEQCDCFFDLPFMCTKEDFWNMLTVGYNPRNEEFVVPDLTQEHSLEHLPKDWVFGSSSFRC